MTPMTDDRRIARIYYVEGMVQGVGYRYFVRRVAQQLRIAGYAKNLRDGRVEVYAIGTGEALGAFRRKLEQGPQAAAVWEVGEEPAELLPRFGDEFSIERDI